MAGTDSNELAGGAPAGLGMSVGRLEAFSDGVLAIVITLLILEIKVPAAGDGGLGSALGRQWPQYAAFLMLALAFLYLLPTPDVRG